MTIQEQAQKEFAMRQLEQRHAKERDSLYEFILYTYLHEKKLTIDENRHIKLICEKLEDVFYGRIKRLMINVPPRSLKTQIVSIMYPARCLGKQNDIKFMDISYSSTLAQRNSLDCRDIYKSHTYLSIFPRRGEIKDDQDTKQHRETTAGGQYYSAGSTGSITGLGADCITGDTVILTDKGTIQIKDIINHGKLCAYSYNHSNNTIELKPIVAFRKIPKKNVYKITTSKGNTIKTTGDHRVFVLGQGYKKTQDIQIGDTVKEMMNMQEMSQTEMMKVKNVSGMLLGNEKGNITNNMGLLQIHDGKKDQGYKKIIEKMMQSSILFKNMCNKFSQLTQKIKMYKLGMIQEENEHILQGGMQIKFYTEKETGQDDTVSGMLKKNISIIVDNKILFYAMQKRQSFQDYAVGMKLKLQTLTCIRHLPKRILQNEKTNITERLKYVYNMLHNYLTSNTSQRQKSVEQQHGQPSDCMLTSSYNTPSYGTDTISSIELVKGKVDVYDIQVEGNNNFFGNGILIHNCVIMDDPLKPDEGNSEVVRTGVNNNYHSTIYSRLNNKSDGAIIIIMQRLHDDDLCGHLIELEQQGGEKRDKVVIQAIAEDDEEYRKKGESFFEKRFPLAILEEMKKGDKQIFSSQYQQEPTNKETQEFHQEWIKYHGNEACPTPKGLRIFTAVDPAFKQGQQNDQTSIITAGFSFDNCYILEQTSGKRTADVMQDKIIYHIKKREPENIGIESIQAQSMISTFLKREMDKQGFHTTITEIGQTKDKNTRIRKLIPLYRDGCIYHNMHNCQELEQQLYKFPKGKHDDCIDALQMLYDMYILQPNTGVKHNQFRVTRDINGNPSII